MLPNPPDRDAPIEAVCAATYHADLVPAFAFVFRVEATRTRFTVYASNSDAYTINSTYRLTICDPGQLPLVLAADEAGFLQQCLRLVEDRWHEAIGQAGAGTTRPEADRTAEPGHLTVEPSPAGYRTIADRLRHEMDRVRRLRERLDQLLAQLPNQDGDRPDHQPSQPHHPNRQPLGTGHAHPRRAGSAPVATETATVEHLP